VQDNILEMSNITKTFPGVKALSDVSFSVQRGEIHALVGENGAGKSTLMKILNGVYQADSGKIFIDDKQLFLRNTMDARNAGIGLIFQEFNLVNQLSAAENIFLNRLKKKGPMVDWREINKNAQNIVDELGFAFNVKTIVENLSAAQKQLVEIAKVLSENARLLVMDEPTSSLTITETENLLNIVKKLKDNGITIIYISHKLEEVFKISDTCTVLRDGRIIETRKTEDFTQNEIIERMVGRSVDVEYPKRESKIGEVILEVKNISRGSLIKHISFELHRGEILGIAGLVGSGRTELAELLFGVQKIDGGEVYINGKRVHIHSTYDGKREGIGFLTEDRKETGLVLAYDLIQNISITNLHKTKNGPFLSVKKESIAVDHYAKQLNIKTPSMKQLAGNLSGGNQQKVVFAKWLFSDADILILDEPTRGIDVGAKYEIYLLMNRLVEEGKSIIMISSELPEVLGMSDRVIVLSAGELVGEFSQREATAEAVMTLAIQN
jgi:ABC-type sugar transport system ATPase subunit